MEERGVWHLGRIGGDRGVRGYGAVKTRGYITVSVDRGAVYWALVLGLWRGI